MKFNQQNIKSGDTVETQDGLTHTVLNTGKFTFNVKETENPETGKAQHYFYPAIKAKK